ncbi:MAG: hypothetical protein MJ025_03920 [Victivallaceae bacterium]|nr:hypothetical protein [Victivallaceae bacterium]
MKGTTVEITYFEEIKRKLVHLSSLWMVIVTLLVDSQLARVLLFLGILLFVLVSEHSYSCNGRYLGRLYGVIFGRMLRARANPGQWIVSGAAPVLAAAVIVNLMFPRHVAAMSLAIMLVGDAFAALVGRRFGRTKLVDGKSLEGTLAFVASASVAMLVIVCACRLGVGMFCLALVGVVTGALAELFQKSLKADDNVVIPLVSGMGMLFAALVTDMVLI